MNQKVLDLIGEAVEHLKQMDLTEVVVEKDLIEVAVAELNQKVLDSSVVVDLYLPDQKKFAVEKDLIEAAAAELNQRELDLTAVSDLHLKPMLTAVAVGKNLFEAEEVVLADHDSVSCED